MPISNCGLLSITGLLPTSLYIPYVSISGQPESSSKLESNEQQFIPSSFNGVATSHSGDGRDELLVLRQPQGFKYLRSIKTSPNGPLKMVPQHVFSLQNLNGKLYKVSIHILLLFADLP